MLTRRQVMETLQEIADGRQEPTPLAFAEALLVILRELDDVKTLAGQAKAAADKAKKR